MKLRVFGFLLILGVGVLPITVAGYLMVGRAKETALHEVRTGNQRVAERAASELRQFVETRVDLLQTVAAPLTRSAKATPDQARRILKNYLLLFPHIRALDVVGLGQGCKEAVSSRLEEGLLDRCGQPPVETALRGQVFLGDIALTSEFAPVMTMAVPLEIAG